MKNLHFRSMSLHRVQGLAVAALLLLVEIGVACAGEPVSRAELEIKIATFSTDVTPRLGHPLLGGTTPPPPAHAIDDPLFARSFVLLGGDRPLVLLSIDWCETRNDAFDRWREVLADAAGTTRVTLTARLRPPGH